MPPHRLTHPTSLTFEQLLPSVRWSPAALAERLDAFVAACAIDDGDRLIFHNYISTPVVAPAAPAPLAPGADASLLHDSAEDAPFVRMRHTVLLVVRCDIDADADDADSAPRFHPRPPWARLFFDRCGAQCGALSLREVLPERMRPRPVQVIIDASMSGIQLAGTPVAAASAAATAAAATARAESAEGADAVQSEEPLFRHDASSLLSPVAASSSSSSLAVPMGTPFAFSSAAAAAEYGDRDPLDLSVEQESY